MSGSSLFHSSLSAIAFSLSSSLAVGVVGAVLQLARRAVINTTIAALEVFGIVVAPRRKRRALSIASSPSLERQRESAGRGLTAQNDQLQAPVLGPPLLGVVGCDRVLLAIAGGGDARLGDTALDHGVLHGIGSVEGELLVGRGIPRAVGMPLEGDRYRRIGLEDGRQVAHRADRLRRELGGVLLEPEIVEDESPRNAGVSRAGQP